jgi:hypothetical protein
MIYPIENKTINWITTVKSYVIDPQRSLNSPRVEKRPKFDMNIKGF